MAGSGIVERLRELGLSDYESRAYAALLRWGPLRVSDLAVRAGIPRTKAYEVARSLAKKGLVSLDGRPLTCFALDPEEVLGELVQEEERRARRMRRALEEIRRARAAAQDGQGGRYSLVSGSGAVERIRALASGASRSVHGILDHWGLELALEARRELEEAALGEVDVRLVVDGYDEDVARLAGLSPLARAGPHGGGWSALSFDGSTVVVLDSGAGVGAVLESPPLAGVVESLFERMWASGMPVDAFAELARLGVPGAADIASGGAEIYRGMLEAAPELPQEHLARLADAAYSRFLGVLPELDSEPPEAAMAIWGALLRGGLPGSTVRYDQLTRIMTVEYDGASRMPPTPFFLAFLGYLRSKGMEPSVVHMSSEGGRSVLQLKLRSSLSFQTA